MVMRAILNLKKLKSPKIAKKVIFETKNAPK